MARKLAAEQLAAHLDLDSVAWHPHSPTSRRSLAESQADIEHFVEAHSRWVIEGCYSSLLALVLPFAEQLIFLNPGIETCQHNCRMRPFEPHKYSSKQAQDENLAMLLDWVAQYEQRDDEFSLQAHRRLFDQFHGLKVEYHDNLPFNAERSATSVSPR
ncbi:hypothetical protein EV696_10962 [Permianibacter aggregans]|uniref:Uncharacterized protein n=1 Tax=Permianibacter aggregans TaxID=1510150 RepID=A0A4R6UKY7_9GAMM|nr:hypothetical protein EV696_10962 [Permianibacter aggregans]